MFSGRRLFVFGFTLFIVVMFFWWTKVFNNPKKVFWGMLNNSLATSSVTRSVTESNNDFSVDRYIRLQTGSVNAARALEITKQGNTTISKESVGIPSADYVRYAQIRTDQKSASGGPMDFSSVERIWGKGTSGDGQVNQGQYFVQAILGTVPFASLNKDNRDTLLKFIRDKKVYQVAYDSVKKTKEDRQIIYTYDVQINAQAYFEMLLLFVKLLGLPPIASLDPSAYATIAPLSARFSIAKNSRQLIKITYPSSGQAESYSDYGLALPIETPSATIPLEELQTRIQNIR